MYQKSALALTAMSTAVAGAIVLFTLTAAPAAGGGAGAGGGAAGAGGGGNGRRGRGGAGGAPAEPPASEGVVLPKSESADGSPRINGPRVTGATPGRPFQYRIPATGADITFSADGLPAGLTLNPKTGLITGSLKGPLAVAVTFHAKNAKGEATRQFVIVGGDHKLALTPPLGWNSWNCYGGSVTEDQMHAAADGMEKSGLANHGFQYVNLDDGWNIRGSGPTTRNDDGSIKPNPKFPDMKALGEYVHSKGLKFGIYSGPGPTTCQGLAAAWQHEEQDAKTWASWGVDYIKYDWCNYDQAIGGRPQMTDLAALQKPYQVLRVALDKLDRDVIYSLCQYGWGNVWTWGADESIKGNLWHCTGDISTSANVWTSMSGIGFQQSPHAQYAGPGHWNDTDMLVVGSVGLANGGRPRPTFLTQNEQLTHIGLWSMLAAPLLLGCDMNSMDEFTTNVMCNDEVLAVDQDPLGKQAVRIAALNVDDTPTSAQAPAPPSTTGPDGAPARGRGRGGNPQNSAVKQIWARELIDGTIAVGLFNLGDGPITVSTTLQQLNGDLKTNIAAGSPVRDVWFQKDLPATDGKISAEVPRHGMVFLKIGKPKSDAECIAAIIKMDAPK